MHDMGGGRRRNKEPLGVWMPPQSSNESNSKNTKRKGRQKRLISSHSYRTVSLQATRLFRKRRLPLSASSVSAHGPAARRMTLSRAQTTTTSSSPWHWQSLQIFSSCPRPKRQRFPRKQLMFVAAERSTSLKVKIGQLVINKLASVKHRQSRYKNTARWTLLSDLSINLMPVSMCMCVCVRVCTYVLPICIN